ncbi:Eukaryotic translation initiation factor 5A-4 [Dendrobium catenatum]|uniref:Eukaryotic translation initiation factor 5A-4 n=1 Tax=Dendrobium catenatum TaxID=906689 RepID=A0A2I0WIZ9_9ASPA|nr:Eukaryotic translation initiation factor 5A-4 [Dendrobium catenatum]
MPDEEHHFESKADAGASKTYLQQAGTIRKNGGGEKASSPTDSFAISQIPSILTAWSFFQLLLFSVAPLPAVDCFNFNGTKVVFTCTELMVLLLHFRTEFKNGKYVGESGNRLKELLSKFNPIKFHSLWNFRGHTGNVVVNYFYADHFGRPKTNKNASRHPIARYRARYPNSVPLDTAGNPTLNRTVLSFGDCTESMPLFNIAFL